MRMINESPIVKRLFDLIRERGVTPKKVTEDTGISSTSFTDWKKGKGNPSVYALTRLASYFEVSLDYLINGQEYAGKTRESTVAKIPETELFLNHEDKELVSKFRMIPSECQGKVMLYLDGMLAALEPDSGKRSGE